MRITCCSVRSLISFNKLGPEKEGYFLECLETSEDPSDCEQRSDDYGEIQPGAIRKLGKYYDLPECQEAYRARKHYRVNPPLR